jgi:hypothetical protein
MLIHHSFYDDPRPEKFEELLFNYEKLEEL